MAFISCQDCGWRQDDFWSAEHNPLQIDIEWLKDCLLKERVYLSSEFWLNHPEVALDGVDDNGGWLKGTNLVMLELRKKVRVIENMVCKTEKEWQEQGERLKCPNCNGQLSID